MRSSAMFLAIAAAILIVAISIFLCAHNKSTHHFEGEFPENFLFGAATSSLQVEGAWNTDGKGPHIWDRFAHDHPEKIADGTNNGDAANSYHFYEEDIKALKSIGMNHYRFSLSWPRILPDGSLASVNPAGIVYYNKLIDALLANGIQPIVTIFHFDLPQAIQNLGGLTSEIFVDYFESYVDLVFSLFGDRVKMWTTINEPFIYCTLIHSLNWISPTVESDPGVSEYLCGHNALKAHAVAYRLYQKKYAARFGGKVGISLNANFYYSETNNTDDVRRALEFELGWFANPIFSRDGGYPAVMRERIDRNSIDEGRKQSRLPTFSSQWIKQIRGSADFLGLNYYTSRYVELLKVPTGGKPSHDHDLSLNQSVKPEWKFGNVFFLYSVPAGLGDLLRYIKRQYGDPRVIITENGWADNGELNDQDRVDFLREHLKEALQVVNNGECDLFGYTVWSLIDTWEFKNGFIPKFGLFAVNFTSASKERTPKASAEFMKEVIATRKIPKTM